MTNMLRLAKEMKNLKNLQEPTKAAQNVIIRGRMAVQVAPFSDSLKLGEVSISYLSHSNSALYICKCHHQLKLIEQLMNTTNTNRKVQPQSENLEGDNAKMSKMNIKCARVVEFGIHCNKKHSTYIPIIIGS